MNSLSAEVPQALEDGKTSKLLIVRGANHTYIVDRKERRRSEDIRYIYA
jgi:hypothetical protein